MTALCKTSESMIPRKNHIQPPELFDAIPNYCLTSPSTKRTTANPPKHPQDSYLLWVDQPSALGDRNPSPLAYYDADYPALKRQRYIEPTPYEADTINLDGGNHSFFDVPPADFFGFSRTQETFSSISKKKLFCEDIL